MNRMIAFLLLVFSICILGVWQIVTYYSQYAEPIDQTRQSLMFGGGDTCEGKCNKTATVAKPEQAPGPSGSCTVNAETGELINDGCNGAMGSLRVHYDETCPAKKDYQTGDCNGTTFGDCLGGFSYTKSIRSVVTKVDDVETTTWYCACVYTSSPSAIVGRRAICN